LNDNEEIINEVTVESVVEKYAKETLDKEKEKTSEIVIIDIVIKIITYLN